MIFSVKFAPTHVQTVILTAAVCTVGDSDGRDQPLAAKIPKPPWGRLRSGVGTTAATVVRVLVPVYSPAGDSTPGSAALVRFH